MVKATEGLVQHACKTNADKAFRLSEVITAHGFTGHTLAVIVTTENMINKTLILIMLIVNVHGLCAQDSDLRKNGLLFSIGGEGGIYTLAYERQFGSHKTIKPFLRLGMSIFPIDQRTTLALPISSGAIYNKNKINISLGVGIGPSISYYSFGGSAWRLYSRLFMETGVRYFLKTGKYSIGLRYTPFVSFVENFQYEHWGAITLGIHL
jgi:hypothetical protein